MNHIYKVVWNQTRACWQVVSELVKNNGKVKSLRRRSRRERETQGGMVACRQLAAALVVTLGCSLGLAVEPAAAAAEEAPAQEKEQRQTTDLDTYALPEITVEAKRPDWESKLSPGTVTIIRPDDYKGEQKSLPELLKQVPGVHVRDVNGKGQYTTVSVRGSTAAQVGVFIDGVLCNLGGDAAVDISTIPVDNVERIEVYRGYIPARFGGTFMGGVINIVTKKPTKANVSASMGQSSYGGYKGNLQVDATLGRGSLMFGLNRDQSDGDFKYKNGYFASSRAEAEYWYNKDVNGLVGSVNTALANDEGFGMAIPSGGTVTSLDTLSSRVLPGGDIYAAFWDFSNPAQDPSNFGGLEEMTKYYNATYGIYSDVDALKKQLYKNRNLDRLQSADRWRKSNDYKNTDAILKWQDEHWFAKATWKEIDRHYPEPVDNNYAEPVFIDLSDDPIYNHRHQKLTNTEFLGGRRDTVGNLEWGWSVDYLNQKKRYEVDNWQWLEKNMGAVVNVWLPNFLWSQYDSDRWGGKLDGTYKAGKNHLIEFLIDGSREELDCKGWKMDSNDFHSSDTRRRFRNYYEQKIFNAQVQDTITLNQKADLWLTPSVRYNQSTIYGSSKYYDKNTDPQGIKWFNQTDEQTDGKTTWQLALKKKVNDGFTLRATGGTYYRLLNMYEIAGDGAGILPMPNVGADGRSSVFPQPEEGTQWDLSAIWDKPMLGAKTSKLQMTYFHRDSDKMLQLGSWNHFFFVYTNAASAKIDGTEMQANLSWDKWDADLEGTYMNVKDVGYDLSALPGATLWQNNGRLPGQLTYTPKWEGVMRLTYRPDVHWAVFGQLHYTGAMRTSIYDGGEASEQSSLTTLDLGLKYKPTKDLQLVVGVNDVFNKAQDLYEKNIYYADSKPTMLKYPQQGRTYYATVQYIF